MSLYLISGLPGTGKSTIGQELAARGYEVIDADTEFGYFGHLMSETPVVRPEPRRIKRSWYAENGWLWDAAKLRQILAKDTSKTVFVVGGARNENKFYKSFDAVFVLHVSDDTLVQRLRGRNDAYMSHPDFIKRMRIWNLASYDHAKNIQAVIIETEQPVATAVDDIIRHLGVGSA